MKKLILAIGFLVLCNPLVSLAQNEDAQPPMGLDQLSAYSIYYENYKNEEYQSAIRYGRWIYKSMPKKLKGYSRFDLERNLDRLITAYSEIAKQKQEPSVRSAYLDTAQVIFEKVYSEYSADEVNMYDWKFKQARFLQANSNFVENGQEKAYDIYLELFDQKPKQFTEAGDGYYVQITLQHLASQGKKDRALNMINKAEPHAPNDKLLSFFDSMRNKLFDSPEERIKFVKNQIEQNPDSTALIRDLVDLYEQTGQTDLLRQTREKLYKLNPSFENTRGMAEYAINNANYSDAIKYLKEAMGKTDDNSQKAQIALDMSDAYLNQGNLQQARRYARQAMDLDKDLGQPYIQMAYIYGRAVSQCTENRKMTREDKVVYWLVLDYLDRARQVDQTLASQVSNQYKSYQPVTPTQEEKFFNNWEEGQKIEVNGNLHECYSWVNETTTVR